MLSQDKEKGRQVDSSSKNNTVRTWLDLESFLDMNKDKLGCGVMNFATKRSISYEEL